MEQWGIPVRLTRGTEASATATPAGVEHRQILYRVLFDRPATARSLAAVAGACRFVWNEMLDQQAQLYDVARMCGAQPPAPTFFTLGKAFTQLRRVTPWLQAMPYVPVRYTHASVMP